MRASDSDVLIFLIGMLGKELRNFGLAAAGQRQIIVNCGSGNLRRFIDFRNIVSALEPKQVGLAAALPASSAFYRKGKVKPLDILENDTEGAFVHFFCNMRVMDETVLDVKRAEKFVCRLHGLPREIKSVDEATYVKLCQMTGKIYTVRNISKINK